VKSMYRLSGLIAFAALLCFLPCAFGQSPASRNATSATHSVLNYQSPNLLAFALTSGKDLYNNNGKGNQGNNGGYGNGGYGNGGYGNGGNGGGSCGFGKICAPAPPPTPTPHVPEGGTPLMYLLLAGLCCLGAMVLRSRRRASTPETN
jgi:hypothetical protein